MEERGKRERTREMACDDHSIQRCWLCECRNGAVSQGMRQPLEALRVKEVDSPWSLQKNAALSADTLVLPFKTILVLLTSKIIR